MKTIVVTGASKGIGFETALKLVELDNKVIAIARSEDKLNELKLIANSDNLITLTANITQESGLDSIKNTVAKFNSIDCLINNAGMVLNKPFMDTTIQEWDLVFGVNLFAPIQLIKTLKPYFSSDSHIVNISSMGGFQGSDKFPGLAAYSTAKGALAILSESLSVEFSADGISVNCLSLGAVQTEMLAEAFPGFNAPVQPKEMGGFIANFALNGHQFMNGKILPVALNNPE
ncbi:MAG: SDR family oxidoreductase [Balneola sp.]